MNYLYLLAILFLTGCGMPDLTDGGDLTGGGGFNDQDVWPEPEKPTIIINDEDPGNISSFVHDEVVSYLEDFLTLMTYYKVTPVLDISDLTINFNDLSSISTSTAGRCRITIDFIPIVTISQRHWDEYSDWSREELVFHELGHCLLVRDHENEWEKDANRPVSLMYPRIIPQDIYEANVDYYREELFSKTNTWENVTEAMKEPERQTGRKRPGMSLKPTEYFIYAQD